MPCIQRMGAVHSSVIVQGGGLRDSRASGERSPGGTD
jgi:hypothetical protein